jgi:hypothetical protein
MNGQKVKEKSNLTTHASKKTQVPHISICKAPQVLKFLLSNEANDALTTVAKTYKKNTSVSC